MISRLLSSILICFGVNQLGYTQTDTGQRSLTIVGTSVVSQPADEVAFTLSAQGTGNTLFSAVEAAKARSVEIISVLKSLGLVDSNLATSKFSEGDNPNKLLLSSRKDFKATVEIQVRTDRIDKLEDIILALSKIKVDVYNVHFLLRDDFALTQKALRNATERARAKAALLAHELNTTIESVVSIEEILVASPSSSSQVNLRGGRASEVGIYIDGYQQSGLLNSGLGSGLNSGYTRTLFYEQTISRTASVRVVYELKK